MEKDEGEQPQDEVSKTAEDAESTQQKQYEIPKSERTIDLKTLEFKHPLQGVELIEGKVPGVDIHNSPVTGKRFAVGEVSYQNEGEKMTTESGVFEVERRPLDRSYKNSIENEVLLSRAPKAKIRPSLALLLQKSSLTDFIKLRIRVVDDYKTEHVWQRLDRQIGAGTLKTHADYVQQRDKAMLDRRVHLNTLKTPIVKKLEEWNVRYQTLQNLNFIHALVPASKVLELKNLESVHSLNVNHKASNGDASVTECPIGNSWLNNLIDGTEVIQGTQMQQFLCNDFNGQPSSGPYRAAVIEGGVAKNGPERLDWANGPSRWIDPQGCGFWSCGAADPSDYSFHAMWVNGLIAGDLRQNQQSNITTEKAQTQRSGYSKEAEIYGYALEHNTFSFEVAVDHLLGRSNAPIASNVSWGIQPSHIFHDCYGDWDEDEAVNSLYEAGIFPIILAGNELWTGTDCNVWIPGSAISAFTVGGHLSYSSGITLGITGVRTGPLYFKSTYGYDAGRDVIEITAPATRALTSGGAVGGVTLWNNDLEGTSYAAPTVTAAALNFADFYETTYSSWIRNPGALFSSMLLMGDRQAANGKTEVDFDPQWGSGRMLMRMFNTAGMDTPWYYGRYGVCVDHQEEVLFMITNVPADVDNLVAVAHWHDRRHDSNGTLDDIDLRLNIYNGAGTIIGSRSSISGTNNKERVRFPMNTINQTSSIALVLKGYSVTADNEGCGSNSNRVFISWYYEDNDRDDGDGPGIEILPN